MPKNFQILVVDDDDSTRAFLHSVLNAEGYSCQVAADVETAEHVLRNDTVDLALVDLYLGTANGLNVLDLIKVLQPQSSCVIMTAHATVETVARSVAGGAVEYLSKPLMIEELLALIHKFSKVCQGLVLVGRADKYREGHCRHVQPDCVADRSRDRLVC